MSQGTLYANFRIRTWLPRALVKSLKLDVKVLEPEKNEEEWARLFPLKLVPCFVGPDGFKLTEQLAILRYLVSLSDDESEKSRLLGKDFVERAKVLQWMSLANMDLCVTFTRANFGLTGKEPYNKKKVDAAYEDLEKIVQDYELRLKDHKYLVNDEYATLGDYLSAMIFTRVFQFLLGREWREAHPELMAWFTRVTEDPLVSFLYTDVTLCEEAVQPPTKKNSH